MNYLFVYLLWVRMYLFVYYESVFIDLLFVCLLCQNLLIYLFAASQSCIYLFVYLL